MSIPINVLVLEDSISDYELLIRELSQGGFDPVSQRVDSARSLKDALVNNKWDIIISDFSMPQFNALDALTIINELNLDIPFIVSSGTIGEEVAVETMKAGAKDYFLKNNLNMLCPAIKREMREAKRRREHKATGKKLAESERRYRRLFESAKDGILILDAATGKIIDVNPFLTELLDYSHDECLNKNIWELGLFKDIIKNRTNFAELKAKKYIRYENLPLETRSGQHIEVEFVSNVYEVNGNDVIQCNIRDNTQRIRGEEQNRLSREVLELLNTREDSSHLIRDILLIIKNNTGFEALGIRLQEGNDFPYYETNGFSDDFVKTERSLCRKNKAGEIVLDEKGNPFLECLCGNVICGRFDPSQPYYTANGTFWTNSTTKLLTTTTEKDRLTGTRNRCNGEGYESVALIPLRAKDKIIGLLQINDSRPNCFTEEMIIFFEGIGASVGIALARKQTDLALRESEERFRELFTQINSGIAVYEAVDNGKDFVFLDFNATGEKIDKRARDHVIGRKVTDVYPGIEESGLLDILQSVWKTGIPEYQPNSFYKDDRVSGWRENRVFKLPSGKIVAVFDDISERKQLEEQLRQAVKMKAIGQLAGGIAHDFNNALTPLLTICDILLSQLDPELPIHEDIKEIQDCGQRCADLTRQLLAFGRRQPMKFIILNLNDIIVTMDKMLSRVIGEDINLIKHLNPNLGNVKADAGQMEQIIANLVINARDAMPHGGKLIIDTNNITLDAEYSKNHIDVVPGDYVMMAVSDTGTGMDAETQTKIFEPFFTTKEKGKGTGLGLSTVIGIVKQTNGHIWVYSEPGKGTTFKIYLPRVNEESKKLQMKKQFSAESYRGTETILIVEDSENIRRIIRRILSKQGYNILETINGEEAIELINRHKKPINLLIADVIMPGINGKELAKKIAALQPQIKVLYISGYTDSTLNRHIIPDHEINFIQKPFTLESLIVKVREVLDYKG
ncbi:MAG: response regulator [Spirochaetales bacterium]|nr:response regulator [Spirochaetales bacterium]